MIDKPLMPPHEMRIVTWFLEQVRPSQVLEWGAGGSTLYWPPRYDFIERWVSIEHTVAWYEALRPRICDKVDLRREAFPAYWQGVTGKYGLILVDGRERVACLMRAKELLAPGGVVLLHDASRERYKRGWVFEHSAALTDGMANPRSLYGLWNQGLAAFADDSEGEKWLRKAKSL